MNTWCLTELHKKELQTDAGSLILDNLLRLCHTAISLLSSLLTVLSTMTKFVSHNCVSALCNNHDNGNFIQVE